MVALRDIRPNEEITLGDFFALPPATQERYLPWAPPFIRQMYAERQRTK